MKIDQQLANIRQPIFVERIRYKQKKHTCNVHYHNHYEIYYLLSGNRTYLIGDKMLKIYANSIVLIRPGLPHQTFGEEFERILINFSRESLREVFCERFTDELLETFDNFYLSPQQHSVGNLFESILKNYDSGNNRMLTLQLAELLTYIRTVFRTEDKKRSLPPPSASPLLDSMINYMNENYDSINNIEEISNKFFLSKYHLCHLFSKEIGLPPIAYLTNIKIAHACDYLRNTSMSITDISTRCGFNSSSYFFRIFKKITQLSPKEYRKNYSSLK